MSAIGNFFWFILGGVFMGLGWWLVGLVACLTIIGLPWGKACFVIGQFAFLPFGKVAVSRKDLLNKDDIGTGIFGTVGNIVWFMPRPGSREPGAGSQGQVSQLALLISRTIYSCYK